MHGMIRLIFSALPALLASTSLIAAEPADDNKPISTEATVEAGQVVKGEYDGGPLDHVWTSRLGAWLKVERIVDERLDLRTTAGLIAWSPVPTGVFWESRELYWSPSLGEAQAIYKFGDVEKPWLEAAFGYFPFKYNPEARNLGEYMYRTQAYPPIVMNTNWIIVNRDQAYLAGLHLSQKLGPFYHDLLVTTETEDDPLWDFSVGYLAGVKIGAFLDVGAGLNLWRYLSVNQSRTTPKVGSNQYVQGADTVYYSYMAIKAVGRLTFDIKGLIPTGLLGKEDLKLYAEAAVLGFKKYPVLYDTLKQRIPLMLGFNFPAFKVLDVLALEWEWFGSPYPNDTKPEIQSMVPMPASPLGDRKADDIKWSVYAQRQVVQGLTLRLQVARDHLRLVSWTPDEKRLFYRENLVKQDEWYWMLQVTYGI